MSNEVALTILIPFCIVAISLLAIFLTAKIKKRRKRRAIERGVVDLVRQVQK
jgi:hypothetical protein